MKFKDMPRKYEELVAMEVPRIINSKAHYDRVWEIVSMMAGHNKNTEQQDYFELLSMLVEQWEADHCELFKEHDRPEVIPVRKTLESGDLDKDYDPDIVGTLVHQQREISSLLRVLSDRVVELERKVGNETQTKKGNSDQKEEKGRTKKR